jgi:hypothetical protein
MDAISFTANILISAGVVPHHQDPDFPAPRSKRAVTAAQLTLT